MQTTYRAVSSLSPRFSAEGARGERGTALAGEADVPTVAESGVRDFEAGSWYGLLAPAATPRAIVERINRDVVRILQLPDVRERLIAEAFELPSDTPEQFAAHIRADVARWAKVVREAGIKPN